MPRSVNHVAAQWATLLSGLLAAAPAVGQAPEDALAGRWIPSLGITGGATFQNQDSSVESTCQVGGFGNAREVGNCSGFPNGFPTPGPGPAPLRPISGTQVPLEIDGSDLAVSPFVGANLQLLTPEIPIPTRPRLFVQGEVLPTFATDRNIAAEGEPTGITVPTFESGGNAGLPKPPTAFFQNEFLGVGSRTTSTVETLAYGGSLGLAFPFELRGRRLLLKPSVAWLRYEVKIEGIVEAGIKDDQPDFRPGPNARDCTFLPNNVSPVTATCSGISLSGSESKWFQGIGPGLELEMEAARWGPVGASLYVDARAYRVLGNRDVSFSDSQSFPALPPQRFPPPAVDFSRGLPADTYTANWSFSVDPWIYRAGVGIRFSWLGPRAY